MDVDVDVDVDVVCLGESMVTFLPSQGGRLADVPSFTRAIGGAESNVACALAAAGHRVRWVGRVGRDGFGDHLVEAIGGYGVDVSGVGRDAGRATGVYFRTDVERGEEGHEVAYYRAGSAASAMSLANVPYAAVGGVGVRILHLTGITAALSDSCRELVRGLVRREWPGRPSVVSFDVNYRPGLWADRDVAGEVLLGLAREADVVFVGVDEAEALWGVRGAEGVRALLPEPGVVVVKGGGEGAVSFERGGGRCAGPFPTPPLPEPGALPPAPRSSNAGRAEGLGAPPPDPRASSAGGADEPGVLPPHPRASSAAGAVMPGALPLDPNPPSAGGAGVPRALPLGPCVSDAGEVAESEAPPPHPRASSAGGAGVPGVLPLDPCVSDAGEVAESEAPSPDPRASNADGAGVPGVLPLDPCVSDDGRAGELGAPPPHPRASSAGGAGVPGVLPLDPCVSDAGEVAESEAPSPDPRASSAGGAGAGWQLQPARRLRARPSGRTGSGAQPQFREGAGWGKAPRSGPVGTRAGSGSGSCTGAGSGAGAESGADAVTSSPSPRVAVLAPTGAGDAFAAGFLHGLLRGLGPRERLRHGHLMAAAVLTAPGDLADPPPRDLADRLVALDDRAWGRLHLGPGWTGRDQEVRTP